MYYMITASVSLHEMATKKPGPDVPTPAVLLQVAVFLHQQPRTLPLDSLHPIARRDMRRAGVERVDVIPADVTLEDLDLRLRTDRPNDLAEPDADVTTQQLLAILRGPPLVQLDVEPGMGGPSAVLHPANLTLFHGALLREGRIHLAATEAVAVPGEASVNPPATLPATR
jgi:hypothetical protein